MAPMLGLRSTWIAVVEMAGRLGVMGGCQNTAERTR